MGNELKQLERERQETLEEIERLRLVLEEQEVDISEDEADPDIFERDKTMALLQTLERKLESIDYAIRLAQRGAYGICEMCGKRIDPARLRALPHTTLCVRCKADLERRARRY
jgi:RNA polymerase-binding transcription factor DksA